MKKLLIILLFVPLISFGQNKKNDTIYNTQNINLNFKSVIIPSVLIGYGIIGINNDALKDFNYDIQERLKGQRYNNIKIEWFDYNTALNVMRPYNLEKKDLLTQINCILT